VEPGDQYALLAGRSDFDVAESAAKLNTPQSDGLHGLRHAPPVGSINRANDTSAPLTKVSLHLQHYGVPAADIDVTGIPIHPVFAETGGSGRVFWHGRDWWGIGRSCCNCAADSAYGDRSRAVCIARCWRVEKPVRAGSGVACEERNEELKVALDKLPTPERPIALKILGLTARDRSIDGLRRPGRLEARRADHL